MATTYKYFDIEVSQQAFIILVSGTIIAALLFIAGLFTGSLYGTIGLLLFSLVMLGMTFYVGYMVNCTIVGHCNTLAWFLVVVEVGILLAYSLRMYFLMDALSNLSKTIGKNNVKTKNQSKK